MIRIGFTWNWHLIFIWCIILSFLRHYLFGCAKALLHLQNTVFRSFNWEEAFDLKDQHFPIKFLDIEKSILVQLVEEFILGLKKVGFDEI